MTVGGAVQGHGGYERMNIHIRIGKLTVEAELNNTPTGQKIAQALPITASFNT
jgi:hypothetical protein